MTKMKKGDTIKNTNNMKLCAMKACKYPAKDGASFLKPRI